MASPATYDELAQTFIAALQADSVLTNSSTGILPSWSPANGPTPSRANSIFYGEPSVSIPSFPCVSVYTGKVGADDRLLQEQPMASPAAVLLVRIVGLSQDLQAVATEIDSYLPSVWWGGAIDTANFKVIMIDTSGDWQADWVPDNYSTSTGQQLESIIKPFRVIGANKNVSS